MAARIVELYRDVLQNCEETGLSFKWVLERVFSDYPAVLTRKAVAERLHLDPSQLSHYCTGKRLPSTINDVDTLVLAIIEVLKEANVSIAVADLYDEFVISYLCSVLMKRNLLEQIEARLRRLWQREP